MDEELQKHEDYAQKLLAQQQKLHLDEQQEPLYPYAPEDYKKLEIVGHLFEDGQYLPVKVFINATVMPAAHHNAKKRIAARKWWQFWSLI